MNKGFLKNVTVVTVKKGILNTFYFYNCNFLSIFINNKNIGNLTVTTVTRFPKTLYLWGLRALQMIWGTVTKCNMEKGVIS